MSDHLTKMWGPTVQEQRAASGGRTARGNAMLAINNDVELLLTPFDGHVQVGMGGEWWNGWLKPGVEEFRHRKHGVDPGYQPVRVKSTVSGTEMKIEVSGGFGHEATFKLKLS